MGRAPAAAASTLLLAVAVLVRADDAVLHEFVPDVDPNEAMLGLAEPDGSSAAIEYAGEVLPAPELGQSDGRVPPMVAEQGDGALGEEPGRRSPTFRPDRLTELEGTLSYYAAFNPAIAPFKRVTALDQVVLAEDGVTPVLKVGDARKRRIVVGDGPAPDARARDPFWGEARLDFSAGRLVPLPSVSPESRVLSLRGEPTARLTILRDGADNYFARIDEGAPRTTVAVAFLTDAPRSYFGTELPTIPLSLAGEGLHPVPASVRQRGLVLASELGIAPGADLRTAVHRLVAHFRAFEESAEPPDDSGDIYMDLVRAQKGVCRHRAYGFVVTAQALGILARFVQNEAHSWVEVAVPGAGFMRIDLGGAAHGLEAHGAGDRPVYQPVDPDRLPRPPAYEESYSQLGPTASGLREPEDLEGRWVGPAEDPASAAASSSFAGTAEGHAEPREGADGRVALTLAVDQRRSRVLRGRKLSLTGRVRGPDGAGVVGQRVEISLAAPDRRERMLLGVTVTTQEGYFRAALGIPPDLSVGDYRLVVIAPGDENYLPGVAP